MEQQTASRSSLPPELFSALAPRDRIVCIACISTSTPRTMTLMQVSRLTMRRTLGAPRPTQTAPRRGLATHEPEVSWAEYRSGQKTFAEWVDANRHIVAGSMFGFYVGLAVWKLRPGKGKKEKDGEAAAEKAVEEPAK